MAQMLREVPAKKRKVIVLVGRHPNEGTINIAQRHHSDWEKHGAVVVRIPGRWTPHAIWQNAARGKETIMRASRNEVKPSDKDVISFLLRRGFKVPVVNFHSTSLGYPGAHTSKCLVHYLLSIKSRIHAHPLFAHAISGSQKTEVLAEFLYLGKPVANKRLRSFVQQYSNREAGSGMHPSYLGNSRITREALSLFSKEGAHGFEEVLAHLAKTQLKQRAVYTNLW